MIDENSPLPSDPIPSALPSPTDDGAPVDSSAPPGLVLTPDQLDALGLPSVAPGTTCTISLKATAGSADGGQSFDVLSATPDDDGSAPPVPDAGGDLPPAPLPDEGDDGDTGKLGYDRPVKPKREGLPDTKNMRNL